ncbi:hypothetical protein BHE74_00059238 [Ensete ventricosum]|nr:hypothetical protein BHE74_00059238 [Ensete ventricosum]
MFRLLTREKNRPRVRTTCGRPASDDDAWAAREDDARKGGLLLSSSPLLLLSSFSLLLPFFSLNRPPTVEINRRQSILVVSPSSERSTYR